VFIFLYTTIIPCIYIFFRFEGVVAGQGCHICEETLFDPAFDDLILAFKKRGHSLNNLFEDEVFMATAGQVFYKGYGERNTNGTIHMEADLANAEEPGSKGIQTEDGVPLSCYVGTTETYHSGKWNRATDNSGHLGDLDSPRGCDRLDGLQKYCPTPSVQ